MVHRPIILCKRVIVWHGRRSTSGGRGDGVLLQEGGVTGAVRVRPADLFRKTGAVGRRQLIEADDADEASTLLVPSCGATTGGASALCGHRLLRHFCVI